MIQHICGRQTSAIQDSERCVFMKRRLLAILLTFSMALTLAPGAAMMEIYGDEPETNGALNLPDEGAQEPEVVEVSFDPFADYGDDYPDNDELFELYFLKEMYGDEYGSSTYSNYGESRLSGSNLTLYRDLKDLFTRIAGGEVSSTQNIPTPSTASWTSESELKTGVSLVMAFLQADHPELLFWYEKTVGMTYHYHPTSPHRITDITFSVAKDYRDSNQYTVNTTKLARINTAKANAGTIVSKHTGKSNYDKLIAYKDEICTLTNYNHDAIATTYTGGYGDPWQLIYVFDNDPSTNVVCEGYSKAFQYLCDLSTFTAKDGNTVKCYTVSGYMAGGTGAGGHMWNIVAMDDGKNYLVDVTNCDTGSAGAPDLLFLKGANTGTHEIHFTDGSSYTCEYQFACGGQTVAYLYDRDDFGSSHSDMETMWGNEVLTLSATDYTPPVVKKTPTCTAPTAGAATYGSMLSSIALTGGTAKDGETDVPGTWSWESPNTSVGNVGTRTFVVKFVPNDTTAYNTVYNVSVSVTVNPKSLTSVTIAPIPDQPYTGQPITPAVTVTGDGITLVKDTDYTVTYSSNTNVGSATVTVDSKSGSNYTFSQKTQTFQITPKAASITITQASNIIYDGNPVTAGTSGADLNYTYSGDSTTITVKWYEANGTTELGSAPKDAGSYQIGISAAAGATCGAVPEVKESFTIARAAYTYAGPGGRTVSVGAAHPASATVTASGVNSESVSGTLAWYTDAACTAAASGTFTTEGNTTLYWKFTPAPAATNYVSTPRTGSAVFKVDALPQQNIGEFAQSTVNAEFGAAAITTQTLTKVADGGNITYTSSNTSVATVNETTGVVTIVGVGTTTITATAARVEGKYAETTKFYTLTVNPKTTTITVSVAEGPFTYTGSEIKPGVTVTPAEGGTLSGGTDYALTYSNNVNAGTATVTVTRTGGNYTWTPVEKTFTIDKAASPTNQTQAVNVYFGAASGTVTLVKPTVAGELGAQTYAVAVTSDTDSIIKGMPTVNPTTGVLTYELNSGLTKDKTATITVTVTSANYEDYTVTVTVTLVDKLPQTPPAAPALAYTLNPDRMSYTVTIPTVSGAEYSFDGTAWTAVNTLATAVPGSTVTGYIRMAETATHLASPAASAAVTLPKVKALTPVATPAGGSYAGDVEITLACNDAGAAIYYTTNGEAPDPTLESDNGTALYTESFTVKPTATVMAVAVPPAEKAAIMVASDVMTEVYTLYDPAPAIPAPPPGLPSGGGTGSTGSGGTQTPETPSQQPSVTPSPSGQEVVAVPETDVSGSTATAAVSESMGRDMVDQAVRNGSDTVIIAPETPAGVSRTEVSIPSAVVGDIAGKTDAALKVETKNVDVTIPNSALSGLAKQGGEVAVSVEKNGSTVSLEITAAGKPVSNVGGVTVAVSEPGCTAGTVAMLVNEDGSLQVIRQSLASDGTVTVPLNGSAKVVLVDNSKSFADVPASSWASDAVAFASSHELMTGTSSDSFAPGAAMTRGMLAVVLHNLASNPDGAASAGFSDVGDSWYTEAVNWAVSQSIISGYGDGSFGPNDEITREQLAIMLYRYAGSPTVSSSGLPFVDADEVSGYARQAIAWASANGIMSGKSGGVLDPKGGATRAEVAQMLLNFVASQFR